MRTNLEASIAAANEGVTDPATRMARGLLASLHYGLVNQAGIVLVLGLSDLGLSRLLDLRLDFEQARSFMRDLCLTMLRSLGTEPRWQERLVDEALRVVIDAPQQDA